MILTVEILLVILFNTLELNSADDCPGFRHDITIPQDYMKDVPDAHSTGNLTEIQFRYFIRNIKAVKEERYGATDIFTTVNKVPTHLISSSEVMINLEIYMEWNDHRLNFSDCVGMMNPSIMNDIWLPQPFLQYLSSVHQPEQITGNYGYLEATPKDGFIWWIEIIAVIQCPFDFTFYPFDKQECMVKFSSFSFPEDVVLHSSKELSKSYNGIERAFKYSVEYTIMTAKEDLSFFDGDHIYSACGLFINLARNFSPAIINFFLPSFFIVIITFFG